MKINWFKYCKMTPNYYKKNKLIKKGDVSPLNCMWLTAMSNYSLYKLFYINYIWKYV